MMERQNTKNATLRAGVIKNNKDANKVNVEERSSIDDSGVIGPNILQRSKLEGGTLEQSERFSHRLHLKSLFSESLKDHILFVVIVAGIFIIGTAPTMIVFFISAVDTNILEDLPTDGVFIFLILIRTFSILTNSILICSAYSGLNIALKSLVRSIAGCHCFNRGQ